MVEKEPWEVVVKGRDVVIGYACPVCKFFHGATIYASRWEDALVAAREQAERCCNRKCDSCSKPVEDKYHWECRACLAVREQIKEQIRFDNAKKIPEAEYDGWLYFAREYYEDLDALESYCLENELDWPEWVWACKRIEFRIDAETILEQALEDHYEDAADSIPDAARIHLQEMLDEWCDGQKISSWQEDGSRVVILEPRKLVEDD